MDKENIENQVPGSVISDSTNVSQTIEVPATNILETGLGVENETVVTGVAQKSKLKVTIKSWSGCAVWKWLANDDTCGICRVAFDGCCPDCKFAGDDCPLVWGECSHCFHIHCIEKWLSTQQTQHQCPMCRQDWKYKE